VKGLESQYGVTQWQIEKKFGRKVETLQRPHIRTLVGIANSIKDGMVMADSCFETDPSSEAAKGPSKVDELKAKVEAQKSKVEKPKDINPVIDAPKLKTRPVTRFDENGNQYEDEELIDEAQDTLDV
jgi:hypothetical protein